MAIEAIHSELNAAIKYNPHLWGPEELRAIFVVRQTDLADIMQAVRDADPKQVPQHYLICGHRGMGKSTLLRRIALAIQDDAELSRLWLPLNFPEEQYTVRTLSELLLNVLDVLADSLEQAGADPQTLARLDQRIADIATLPSDQAEAAALNYLSTWVTEQQRGLVLLLDSSDLLLQSLAAGEGKLSGNASALWRLRQVLSHQPGLLWIGASYQALETDHQYQDAFHDFFSLHELRPLKLDEMRLALIALARRFGAGRGLKGEAAATEMARTLDSKPERLQTLRLLSGGNPRTMVMLYELFAAGGEDSIQADLKRLLDVMTPLYKSRMETLSEQARKILAHIMENWGPVGLRELEQQSGISNTTISGQLKRLEADGLIEKAALAGGEKRSGYQISERFFNVWYLMRNGTRRLRQRLAWAVEFMRMWFNRDELASLATRRADRHLRRELNDSGSMEWSRAMSLALGDDVRAQALDWSVMLSAHREAFNTRQAVREILPEALFDLDGSDRGFKDAKDYLERFAALDAPLAACPVLLATEREDWIKDVKSSLDLSLAEKENIARSAGNLSRAEYERLSQTFAEERRHSLATYGEAVGEVYAAVRDGEFFPDAPSSKLAVQQMEVRFVAMPQAYGIALTRVWRKHKDEGLESAFQRCIQMEVMDAVLWFRFGYLLHICLKRYKEAEEAYRRAIELDEKQVSSWHNLGVLLQDHLKRFEEAEAAYRRAIELDVKQPSSWYNLGVLLQDHLKRFEEAEAAYRLAIELDGTYALPWNNLGGLLHNHLKRYQEAEAAYRRAIELDAKNAVPWNNLGVLLQDHLNRYEEAEVAYRRAIELDEKDAPSWNGLGNLLQIHLKRFAEAEAAYRRAIELDEKYADPRINLGGLLQDHLKRYDQAEEAYQEAMALDPEHPYTIVNLARLKARQGYEREACALYRQLIALTAPPHSNLLLQAHLWLNNQDAAMQVLNTLSQAAADGDEFQFFRVREQCWECFQIGRGQAWADLMAASPWAEFLLPFRLALVAALNDQPPVGAAPEILALASEVKAEILARS